MHRVDLSRATGAELVLTTVHDGALVEDLVAEWCAEHRQPVVVRLDGPAGGEWQVGAGDASSEVRMDAVDFARTISGRAAGSDLLATRVPF
jgi:hypothetical protein